MHLVIVTSGSRGDVQPYLALAVRATAAGHRVTLATHAMFESMVQARGIAFRPLHGDPVAMLANPGARAWLATGSMGGLWQFAREFGRDFGALFEGLLHDLALVTADADVVLYSAVCMAAAQLHEIRGTTVMAGFLQPLTPTREFPAAGLTYRAPESTWDRRRNRLSHAVGEQLLWQPARRAVNRWRQRTLSAPPVSLAGPFAAQRSASYPVCYAYSPSVLPQPADWPEWIAPTGWWFLDEPAYTPPAALAAFLAAGDAPVCVGFGSMSPQDGERLARTVLEACERAECRVVLLEGWGSVGGLAIPSWAHVQREVPHAWLVPRCAAVVHHGGAGTTGAGVRSGVPSLVVPLGFDQQFWGSRLHALGVSPPPIKRRDLTVANLAAALRTMRTDAAMHSAAASLGAAVQAEDGTGLALARIVAHARSRA
ncbi:MAG: glycosyltransferase family 1 protein [Gemmatimonadaceae bacterium]|nr:glycosyltransferase family 1 protein [Gemmatimonadaceae bacterium]